MENINSSKVEQIREQYPKGTRIRLVRMEDPYTKIPEGTYGTVRMVDDIGTVHVDWDTGSSLGLVMGVDEFMKEPTVDNTVDDVLKQQILTVRDTGLVNMFDVKGVRQVAEAMEFTELVTFLDEDVSGYTEFILHGE